jgi:hypothetical protein
LHFANRGAFDAFAGNHVYAFLIAVLFMGFGGLQKFEDQFVEVFHG